jgi:hypothetical protein
MRSTGGQTQCDRCTGEGCYHCQRRGYNVQCPGCSNDAPELIGKNENEFRCSICGTVFGKDGTVERIDEIGKSDRKVKKDPNYP